MTADKEAADRLSFAHVLELRAAVAAGGRTRDELGELERDTSRIRDLEACGLLVWHGGNTGEATWEKLRNGAVVPTTAGLAFLRAFELGLHHGQAAAMSKPSKGAKR